MVGPVAASQQTPVAPGYGGKRSQNGDQREAEHWLKILEQRADALNDQDMEGPAPNGITPAART